MRAAAGPGCEIRGLRAPRGGARPLPPGDPAGLPVGVRGLRAAGRRGHGARGARCCARATRRWSRWAAGRRSSSTTSRPRGSPRRPDRGARGPRGARATRGGGPRRGRALLVAGRGDGHARRLPAGASPMTRGGGRAGAWRPLVAHSYRLGAAWAARGRAGRRLAASRGRASTGCSCRSSRGATTSWAGWPPSRFAGDCLDVSSPKLLASLLQREGRGRWTAVDLLPDEIARWRALDPALDLRVEDARALSFADGSFDAVACVSVIEHVRGRRRRRGDGRDVAGPAAGRGPAPHHQRGGRGPTTSSWTGRSTASAPARGRAALLRAALLGADACASASWACRGRWTAEEYVRRAAPGARALLRGAAGVVPGRGAAAAGLPAQFRARRGPGEVPPGRHGVAYLRLRRPG